LKTVLDVPTEDKKQICRIVFEEVEPHESGHCSWRAISRPITPANVASFSDLQGPDPMILVRKVAQDDVIVEILRGHG
jgi:hypothetical protein